MKRCLRKVVRGVLPALLMVGMGCAAAPSAEMGQSMPSAGQEEMEIVVAVTVPDAAWQVTVEEIRRVGGEYWVVARLHRRPLMGAQVISTVQDRVSVPLPTLPVKVLLYGKAWRWENAEDYRFFVTRQELDAAFVSAPGEIVWRRPSDM